MAVLLIDTTYFLTVGVLGRDPFWVESSTDHVEKLAPLAQRALEESGEEVERVEVMAGPGPFTGLRAGMAFAAGFSLARAVPLSAGSLLFAESIWAGKEGSKGIVAAVNDARRRQAYFQIFDEKGSELSSMDISSPAKVAQACMDLKRPFSLVGLPGPYFDKIEGALREAGAEFKSLKRPAGSKEWLESMHESIEQRPLPALPIYLRDADAIPLFEGKKDAPSQISAENLLWSLS